MLFLQININSEVPFWLLLISYSVLELIKYAYKKYVVKEDYILTDLKTKVEELKQLNITLTEVNYSLTELVKDKDSIIEEKSKRINLLEMVLDLSIKTFKGEVDKEFIIKTKSYLKEIK